MVKSFYGVFNLLIFQPQVHKQDVNGSRNNALNSVVVVYQYLVYHFSAYIRHFLTSVGVFLSLVANVRIRFTFAIFEFYTNKVIDIKQI